MASAFSILVANRATRTFGYGLTSILLAIYLKLLGGDDIVVVASLGISLLSGAILNVLVGYYGDRFGRRKAMIAFGLLMAVAGLILAVAQTFQFAIVALLLGSTSPTGTEVSPFLAIEQSIVADVAKVGRRTRAFAVYNLSGTLSSAAGALAGGVPYLLSPSAVITADSLRPMFVVYSVLGVVAAMLSAILPHSVELAGRPSRVTLSPQSRTRVARMAALFSMDSFAGGFALQSFISFWFYTVYPESRSLLGPVFFVAGILSAFSFLLAARLGERFGLLETMVITHIPSSVLLIMLPLLPGFNLALMAYLARMSLSQMDVPTRQAYLAGIVGREERTVANAITNTSRNVTQSAGPFCSATVVSALGLSVPFFISGGLKIAYDLSVYMAFRRIAPEST